MGQKPYEYYNRSSALLEFVIMNFSVYLKKQTLLNSNSTIYDMCVYSLVFHKCIYEFTENIYVVSLRLQYEH